MGRGRDVRAKRSVGSRRSVLDLQDKGIARDGRDEEGVQCSVVVLDGANPDMSECPHFITDTAGGRRSDGVLKGGTARAAETESGDLRARDETPMVGCKIGHIKLAGGKDCAQSRTIRIHFSSAFRAHGDLACRLQPTKWRKPRCTCLQFIIGGFCGALC